MKFWSLVAIIELVQSLYTVLQNVDPVDLITGHFDPCDPIDIDLTGYLLQQYLQDHKRRINHVYDMINETSLHDKTVQTENRHKDRKPEKEYTPYQQVFVRNHMTTRQKTRKALHIGRSFSGSPYPQLHKKELWSRR